MSVWQTLEQQHQHQQQQHQQQHQHQQQKQQQQQHQQPFCTTTTMPLPMYLAAAPSSAAAAPVTWDLQNNNNNNNNNNAGPPRKRVKFSSGTPPASLAAQHTATHDDTQQDSKMPAAIMNQQAEPRMDKNEESSLIPMGMTSEIHRGRAHNFVQAIAKLVQDVQANLYLDLDLRNFDTQLSWKFEALATDDLVFLTERLLDLQDIFYAEGKPTHVKMAFHYTKEENLANIRTNGLLTKCDRESSQIQSNYNGSAFGDGIYTCSNPDDFTRYGNVGLIVAQMQGRLEEVSSNYAKNRQQQVWSGDTGIAQNKSPMYADMRVLRESSQCLPLVRYDTTAVTQTHAGRRALYQFHRQLQRLVDDFFNGGATTSVAEYKKVLEKPTSTPPAVTIPTNNQASGVAGVSSATASQSAKDRDAKKQEETFLLFTRVLIKYLEQKDPNVHQQVKAIIKDCAERNKRGEPGYESVPASMRGRLKRVVSESYWERAEAYLRQLLSQKRSAIPPPPQIAPAAKTSNQMPNQGVAVAAGAKVAPNQGGAVAAAAGLAQKSATAPVPNMQNQCQDLCTLVYTAPECLSSNAAENRMVVLEKDEIPKEECAICMAGLESPSKDKIHDTATLNDFTIVAVEGCGHKFHLSCIQEALQHNSRCPTCRQLISEPQGTMPSGTMYITLSPRSCGGYPGTGTIVLSYNLEGGIQKVYHPNPGIHFGSCQRTAYIPDCPEGRQLLKRLQYAFLRGMSFVVGRSLTTGRDNVITWSSIHHKSSMRGGAHGFPDPSYFENCNDELDALGVPKAADLD